MKKNIISVSGGKDSTATILLAIALEVDFECVFADTGHEHQITYDYIDYLREKLCPIRTIKADFSFEINRKREKLESGELPGWTEQATRKALEVLSPTGIPFLDLCLWKGRFPSTMARFCTQFLKRDPIFEQVFFPELDAGNAIWSWQGIRRDESLARANAKTFEVVGGGLFNYRPIALWTADDVFKAHRFMNVKPNPLYLAGMERVGCMPCINVRKSELSEMSRRYPEEVKRVAEWEKLVSKASKRQAGSFFPHKIDPLRKTHGIESVIEWARTDRGGRQFDLVKACDNEECSSAYGLCE